MRGKKLQAVERIEGQDDVWPFDEICDATDRERDEPDHDDRAEPGGNARRAPVLDHEQRQQDGKADRQHNSLESWRDEVEPLDGREHRDRGRDHRIAVKQGCAGHAEDCNHAATIAERSLRERHEAQGAAFTIVVGLEHHDDVLERDDDDERPNHQRQHAEDHVRRKRCRASCGRQ